MLIWFVVVSLIVIGILLIVIEIIFIPGTTIVGIFGFLCLIAGISMSFSEFGTSIGWMATSVTTLILGAVVFYSFKTGAWKRFTLKQSIDSKVNEDQPILLEVGIIGEARSALRPMGKAEFDGVEFEVRSLGRLIETHSKIKVIKLEGRKIFVEPINN